MGGFRLVTSASCSAVRRCDSGHWSMLVSLCWKSPGLPLVVSLLSKGVAVPVVLALALACMPCGEECQQTWSLLGLSLGTCCFSGV